jgi:hypothetical protein
MFIGLNVYASEVETKSNSEVQWSDVIGTVKDVSVVRFCFGSSCSKFTVDIILGGKNERSLNTYSIDASKFVRLNEFKHLTELFDSLNEETSNNLDKQIKKQLVGKKVVLNYNLNPTSFVNDRGFWKSNYEMRDVRLYESSIYFGSTERQEWKDFSTISLTTKSVKLLTLKKFTDGIYVKIEDEKGTKEMYQLNGGMILYNGLSVSDQTGPSPFFMLDMPIGMTLSFLGQHFKYPSLIKSVPTPFSYTHSSGKSNINVNGSAHHINESEIVFDLTAIEQKDRGATIKISGRVDFLEVTPVPLDTVISGWTITHGRNIGKPITESLTNQKVKTIKDLKNLAPEKRKQ